MKLDVLFSFSSNRNRLVRGMGATLFALLAAACGSESGEAASSQSEALIFHPEPCLTPAPTWSATPLEPGLVTFNGEGFEHFACRLPFGDDTVTVSITPLLNGNMIAATQTLVTTSGVGGQTESGPLALGAIYGGFLVDRFPNGCTADSFLLNAIDNTTNTPANGNIGLIVTSPGCQ